MPESAALQHWKDVQRRADAHARNRNPEDDAAVMAAALMCSALRGRLPIPCSPEFFGELAHAEELARMG